MGKYGKKHTIDLSPLAYSICLCGIGGIGKSTLAKEVCEKLVGDEGYIHFNIGREGGVDAINGIITEEIEDWAKFVDVTDDIIENKSDDYKELKVVILDSLDELIRLGEAETIRQEKKANPQKQVDSILSCRGGFGKGQDYCINMILDRIFQLKSVGVQSFIIAHTRRSDVIDAVSQMTYSTLTADTAQRYFNAVKNKMDIVAVGYMDRQIGEVKTGRKNIVTKQEITVNTITEENRIISFRDDSYNIDSKSRFAEIVDKIPFDSDAFIEAIQNAIEAENKRGGISDKEAKKIQADKDKERAKEYADNSATAKANKADPERNEELKSIIVENFKQLKGDAKTEFKQILKNKGISSMDDLLEMPTSDLQSLADYFN